MKIVLTFVCFTTLAGFGYLFTRTKAIKNTVFVRSNVMKYVTGAEITTPARDAVLCARQCSQLFHCVSWAFDKDTGKCYLQPTVDTGPGQVQPFVYADTEAMCGADFLYVPGQTEQGGKGQCKQRIWRNFTWFDGDTFPLPSTPSSGWTMYLKATHLGQTRFTLNLRPSGSDIVLHFDVRINVSNYYVKVVFLAMHRNGGWQNSVDLWDPNPPFPFVPGQQFQLNFTAVSYNQIEIHVDGKYYTNRTILPYSVSDIIYMEHQSDELLVDTLDLWCR